MAEDAFRKEYKPISGEQKETVALIKIKAAELLELIGPSEDRSDKSRCQALAKTKLEEAVMWAVKGWTA